LPQAAPVEQKRELARSLVRLFYDESSVTDAEKHFDTVARRGVPEDVAELPLPLYPRVDLFPSNDLYPRDDKVWIVDLIKLAGFANTNGEARRFIKGGAVRLDGETIADEKLSLPTSELEGKLLQVGKRRYARLVSPR
jgi:tyrosyl-tRNA synthetase